MKSKIFLIAAIASALLGTSSCSSDDPEETTFYIDVPTFSTLGAKLVKMNAGETRNIPVSVYSAGGKVTRFRVQEFYSGQDAFQTVLDLNSEEIAMHYSPSNFKADDFVYTAPSIASDSVNVKLRFYAENSLGETDTRNYTLRVYHKSDLNSATNVSIYPDASKRNGLYLNESDPSRGIQTITVSGEDVDILAVAAAEGEEGLPGVLTTRKAEFYFLPTSTLNFDYASKANLQQAWEAAWANPNTTPNNRIEGLATGSIFVIGRGATAIGIIKVININDAEGTGNDYYTLSIRLV